MSRTIKDSVDLLEQSLTDCKAALTEKGVAEVDSIKISDVNEKIAEIKAGEDYSKLYSDYIQKVEFANQNSEDYKEVKFGENVRLGNENKFKIRVTPTAKLNNCHVYFFDGYYKDIKDNSVKKDVFIIENLVNNGYLVTHPCYLLGDNVYPFVFYFLAEEPYLS